MNVARWVGVLGAGVVLGGCGGYSSLGEIPGKGGTDGTGTGGDNSMGAQAGQGTTVSGGMGTGATGGGMGTGATGGDMGMGNVGNTGGDQGMGNVGNTGGDQGMGATGGIVGGLCMVDADCAQPRGCTMCLDGTIACARAVCTMNQCVYLAASCDLQAPGCPPADVASCDPGAGQLCDSTQCITGEKYPPGTADRGFGVACKFQPDGSGPDFGCLDGEWCQYDLNACRCGHFEGCQVGERCEPCMGDRCDVPPGDSRCVRDIACTADNLDSCAAGPGKVCADGALACAPATACSEMSAGPGATRCNGAVGGCCAAGEWCFDDQECRCGTHPACGDGQDCVLDGVGYYECLKRGPVDK